MSLAKQVAVAAALLISTVVGYALYNSQRKRNATNHGYSYDYQNGRKRQCGICLKEMNSSEEVTLPCGHSFCTRCLIPLYFGTQTSCCDCRKELDPHDLNVLKRRLLH